MLQLRGRMARVSFIIRMSLSGAVFASLFLVIAARLYWVQVVRHDELYGEAKSVYTTKKIKKGERGKIYDVEGHLLAGNIPCVDVIADPSLAGDVAKCRETAFYLADKLKIPPFEIYRRLAVKKRGDTEIKYSVIKRNVDLPLGNLIKQEMEEKKMKGVSLVEKSKRFYPKAEMLANILGIMTVSGDELRPVLGIEKVVDKDATPTEASSIFEHDRKGIPFAYGTRIAGPERDGNNVFLTISEPIQTIVEEELDGLMKEYRPKAAYVIMVDPFTGNILAIAQRPTFDPNDRDSITPEKWRDRVLTDVFEPGSTMKPFAISGALDCGVVAPSTSFDCEKGHWFYAGKLLRDAHPYGILTVSEIIKVSSNIGTAKISIKLGEKRLYQTLRRFGFGQGTGIPIQPEATGQFRRLAKWDKLSITRFPIGQGISCSPLQLVRAYCALANGGTLVKIRLIDREENPETGEIVYKKPDPGTKVFANDGTYKKILDMLKLTTRKGGTAIKAAVKGYDVAGKTGTSQKWVDGEYSSSCFNSTFVGFVPADNPRFVMLVMADEPQGSHYGGVVSAPTFSRIAEKTLRYLNVPPQYPEELEPKQVSDSR